LKNRCHGRPGIEPTTLGLSSLSSAYGHSQATHVQSKKDFGLYGQNELWFFFEIYLSKVIEIDKG